MYTNKFMTTQDVFEMYMLGTYGFASALSVGNVSARLWLQMLDDNDVKPISTQ